MRPHMTLSEELQWRGFVNQTTFPKLSDLDARKYTLYFGVDPSADSMTVGNFAAAMMVRRFLDHGHKVILLVGGGTGAIGDPGGKNEERNLLTLEQTAHNKKAIETQYKQVFSGQDFTIVDNYDWLSKLNLLDFLRDIGKHFGMSTLLQRDFIASRIGEGGAGISYTEFSYTLLQGYDYLHLHEKYDVNLQLCGADQWGNVLSGVDLIRKKTGHEVHAFSCPLVLNKSTGKKFGKSEDGAVWLDAHKTSVYKFYQFWLNVDDEGVEDYLKYFTLLQKPEVDVAMAELAKNPRERHAQKILAYEVTKLVHGEARANAARQVTDVLFGDTKVGELKEDQLELLAEEVPAAGAGELADVLVAAEIAASKGEARRLISGGAISVNGEKAQSETQKVTAPALIKKGKNSFALVR